MQIFKVCLAIFQHSALNVKYFYFIGFWWIAVKSHVSVERDKIRSHRKSFICWYRLVDTVLEFWVSDLPMWCYNYKSIKRVNNRKIKPGEFENHFERKFCWIFTIVRRYFEKHFAYVLNRWSVGCRCYPKLGQS